MAESISTERKILGDDYAAIAQSHYPALADLPAEDVLALARQLREQRDRLRGMLHTNRRARRGKGEPRAVSGNDVALARRKQVYAAALKRVNHRLDILQGEARRAWHAAALRDALARKHAARAHHPAAGDSADVGMHAKPSRKRTVRTDPREIGRVSAFVKAAQARRDR
ncbi:hypothetical protein GWK16_20530 [Roseomonas sp. JC162]|uniref:Uncharacterized protein n=1 Tax=Neoroseomonas marina TaxID=1232220 RepID=A0A848EJK4_9PROT|nr:hypothetical protein [Neoroseomonas marina]NMJ43645.1 hypothetical protein [Neoroseomonas marina]